MKTMELNNIVWRGDKHFVAQCLNVDVSSFGDSKEEALDNLILKTTISKLNKVVKEQRINPASILHQASILKPILNKKFSL
jgi:hypothetical protein